MEPCTHCTNLCWLGHWAVSFTAAPVKSTVAMALTWGCTCFMLTCKAASTSEVLDESSAEPKLYADAVHMCMGEVAQARHVTRII